MDIEQATEEEYRRSFDCLPISWQQLQISEEGVNPIQSRRKRSAPTPEAEEGPFSRYNRMQQKLSLIESKKRMPYVEPKPDKHEHSNAMRWDRLKVRLSLSFPRSLPFSNFS